MSMKRAPQGLSPNVFEAFRRVVYSVGVDKLAPLMGLRAGTLYNKADADDHSHNQPTLRDLVVVTQISGDLSILDELEAMFGRAAYDCAQHQGVSDEALLDLLTSLGREHGEFHGALSQGLKEQRFTRESLRRIRMEAFDVIGALMTLVNRLEGYVDEDDHPRAT